MVLTDWSEVHHQFHRRLIVDREGIGRAGVPNPRLISLLFEPTRVKVTGGVTNLPVSSNISASGP